MQAIQWVWPVILLTGLPFAPESPYWLVRKNRREDAKRSLEKLSSKKNPPDTDAFLNMIEQTDLLEQELEATTTYLDCLKGENLRRTEISVMVYLIQVIAGNPLIGYANFFFEQAGLNAADAFDSELTCSLLNPVLTHHSGRRKHRARLCRNLRFLGINIIRAPAPPTYEDKLLAD
jgi:hypothetical protein